MPTSPSSNPVRNPRMSDVARLAGVSQQTVSRVVNESTNVSAAVRATVENAIAQLRYRPNTAARALATRRSKNLGVVSFGTSQYGPTLALFGIAQSARSAGYATSLVTLDGVDRDTLRSALVHLVANSVDAIIVIAPVVGVMEVLEGLALGLPLVTFEPGVEQAGASVAVDDALGARLATQHLLDQGHVTVWHVSGPEGWLGSDARVRGWRMTLADSGRVAHKILLGDWSSNSGYAAGLRVAADPAITAVFVANDQMAIGLLKALHDSGLRVPEDVSVVGFDDVPEAKYCQPALTTVRVDFDLVGRLCVERVLKLLDEAPVGPMVQLRPELIVRASVARPARTPSRSRRTSLATRTNH